MKVDNNKLLTKLAGIVGVTSIGFLINLPAGAQDKLNQNPSIFSEGTYSRTQRVLTNAQYTPSKPTIDTQKQELPKKTKKETAQTTPGEKLNPAPSILQECPYNRAACPGGGSSAPSATPPATTPSEVPTTTPPAPGGEVTPTLTPTEPTPTPTPEGTEKPPTKPSDRSDSNKNIVAVAEANGSFKTLTKALEAAGLTKTLQGKGPFTVFAPTDAAFAELPPDALKDLLKPENKEVLVKILTYHVVKGQVLSTDLKAGEVKSVEGGPISVKTEGGVTVNDAKVVQADVKASNGVIHVINKVILPPNL
ncbi:fasciclin domain-containing protein [Brunnivagina elsteri]|uniref:Beta-Ig-H3/fasciclin n=1 Tax=Brunnivagina elsteri CCALA 953 TaxID=987040 RepID=A0A2A2THE5_9CYAN|nr:fasciclin domain-containing protein [Calothrix elsteri]PAX53055.1 beta-Ig-H3/fasciclin [Calothrix elsteri CCALA 953]